MRRRQLPGEPEPPTKGELKRQAQGVQELADRLVAAPEAVLSGLDLPETLRDAIDLARRITSHGALVRQKHYVGKLLRRMDVEPLRAALESDEAARQREARRFKEIERWRDRIVDEGDPAVDALLAAHPGLDGAPLRSLAAEARREREAGGPHKAARSLFRALGKALAAA